MKRVYICLISVSLILITSSISAQITLTLEECREMALTNSKITSISQLKIDKSFLESQSYKTNFLPKFYSQGSYSLYNKDFEYTLSIPELQILPPIPIELSMNNLYTFGIKATQPIYMGGKIRGAYKASLIGSSITQLSKRVSDAQVIFEVDQAYWNLIKAIESTKLAMQYTELVNSLLQDVSNAYQSGMRNKVDVLMVDVKINEAKLALKKSENAVRLANMNLAQKIGLPLSKDILPKYSIDNSVDGVIIKGDSQAIVYEKDEFAMLSHKISLLQEHRKILRAEYLPEVAIVASYDYANGLKINDHKVLDGTILNAMLMVKIPIFEWGGKRDKERAAKKEIDISIMEREHAKEMMILEIEQAKYMLEESYLLFNIANSALLASDENLKMSNDAYSSGKINLSDLLKAQTDWQKIYLEWIDSFASLKISESKYKKAIGELL